MSRNESCMSGTRLCWIFYARDKRRSPFQSFALMLFEKFWPDIKGHLPVAMYFVPGELYNPPAHYLQKGLVAAGRSAFYGCSKESKHLDHMDHLTLKLFLLVPSKDTPGYYGYDSAPSLHHAPSRPLHKASHRNSRLSGWHRWRNSMTRFSWTHGPSIVLY